MIFHPTIFLVTDKLLTPTTLLVDASWQAPENEENRQKLQFTVIGLLILQVCSNLWIGSVLKNHPLLLFYWDAGASHAETGLSFDVQSTQPMQ